ncbi:hypothetical protein DRN97_00485 [Methanosarcinales archaeon]|nr:MAG: hypothetical protein DRN97_00485 [Methanosarcinales archaeon]
MKKNPYHRYALMDNPFRFEERRDISLFHVKQEMDDVIEDAFYDVIEKNRKAILQIVGGRGIGKTERLLLLAERAKEEGASWCYINAKGKDAFFVIVEILNAVSRSKRKLFIIKPGWLKEIEEVNRSIMNKRTIDVDKLSNAISGALNEQSPTFLLMDEPDIGAGVSGELLMQLLCAVFDKTDRGLLIAITTEKEVEWITEKVELKGFDEREAELFIAKRLLSERIIGEKLEPLYPFTPDAVRQVNELVNGNPKELLEKMANILDLSVRRRIGLIDKDFVVRVMSR